MFQAVLFDLYGVLAENGWQAFKKRHFTDRPEAWDVLRALGQKVDAKQAAYDTLIHEIAKASGTHVDIVKSSLEDTRANNELLGFIATELGAYKKAIVSNASRDVVPELLSPDERGLFDAQILSAEIGYTKPSIEMFQVACNRLGVTPKKCLFIDDKQENIMTATDIGMRAILFVSTDQAIKDITKVLNQ